MISGFWERSLSPACEGVLELLWDLPGGVEFVSDPLPEKERCIAEVKPDFLKRYFQQIRSQCIDLLQNRSYSLPQRILLMCTVLKDLAEEKVDVESWLAQTRALGSGSALAEALRLPGAEKGLPLFLSANLKVLGSVSDEDTMFGPVLDEVLNGLGIVLQEGGTRISLPMEPYLTAQARFEDKFKGRPRWKNTDTIRFSIK